MPQENIDVARAAYDAWNRSDFDRFIEHLTDDCELRNRPELFPDLDDVYIGEQGWAKFWGVWRDAWETIEVEIDRLIDLGDHELLSLIRFEGVGRGSGAPASLDVAHWITIRDGRVARVTVMSPDDALEAAELST